jgi:hypothetical protein
MSKDWASNPPFSKGLLMAAPANPVNPAPANARFGWSSTSPEARSIRAFRRSGLEHFAVVSFDCAKARSKFIVADFYGNILVHFTVVEHNRPNMATLPLFSV